MTAAHDPLCGECSPHDHYCHCRMLARARADERERIALAIEQAALFWQVYLDSGPTEIERQLAWTRVDTLKGCEAIARGEQP